MRSPSRLALGAVLSACAVGSGLVVTDGVAASGSMGSPAPSPSPSPAVCARPAPVLGPPAVDQPRVRDSGTVRLSTTLDLVDAGGCTLQGNRPVTQVEVYARTLGSSGFTSIGTTSTNAAGTWTWSASLSASTEFAYAVAGGRLSPPSTVRVDRTQGSCEGRVSLSAPERVPAGTRFRVSGTSAGSEPEAELVLHQAGDPSGLRVQQVTVDEEGLFRADLLAEDIVSGYAVVGECASPGFSTYPQPTVSGPASVRRGDTALLQVRARPDEVVEVWFRRAGTSTFLRGRTGRVAADGTYATGFVASADHRYLVRVLGGPQSAVRLTRVR